MNRAARLATIGAAGVVVGLTLARLWPSWVTPPTSAPLVEPLEPPPLLLPPPPTRAYGDDVGRAPGLRDVDRRIVDAATAALAAAGLSEAAQGGGAFEAERAAAERVLPDSPAIRALRPLAATGAPSRASLADSLRDDARGDWFTRLRRDLSPADEPKILGEAQAQARAGDLAAALVTLDALPDFAQAPLARWRAEAHRRVQIDRQVAALRAEALASLAELRDAP